MNRPTAEQFEKAKFLIRENTAKEHRIQMLEKLITSTKAIDDAQNSSRFDRANFTKNPNNLAGICALYHQTDPATRNLLLSSYHLLLTGMISPLTPGSKAYKIDFNALSNKARPFLVAPFINLIIGGEYPRLCLEQSNLEAGSLTYIITGGASNPANWLPHIDTISQWLGGHWALTAHTINSITLTRRKPLPKRIAFTNTYLKKGMLFTGINSTTHQPAYIPFTEMTSGTFIPGATGTGKSNALHILLQSIFTNLDLFSAVYLVDGKDGVAFNRYRNIAPDKVKVLWDEPDLWELTSKLITTMKERNARQRDVGIDNATVDFIAVVIDEMSTYTAKPSIDPKNPDNKHHAQFIDDLAKLAKRGRSTGIRLIITAQEPVNADIPSNVRANCATTIAFQIPMDAHATALFGKLDSLPADPRKLKQGHAVIKQALSGKIELVQFPLSHHPSTRGSP